MTIALRNLNQSVYERVQCEELLRTLDVHSRLHLALGVAIGICATFAALNLWIG